MEVSSDSGNELLDSSVTEDEEGDEEYLKRIAEETGSKVVKG